MFVWNSDVQLNREDYNFVKAGSKPTIMSLRFVDMLFFLKETLKKFAVQGTKDFAALYLKIMAAIRCKNI